MFSKWKRYIAVFAATVLPIFSALWSAILSRITSSAGVAPSWWISYLPFLYVGVICVVSGTSAYVIHFKPVRDLEKPVLNFLGFLSEKPLRLGKRMGIAPRMNIMVAYRPWYFPLKKRIKVVWSANMDSNPDVRFACSVDQGVCGRAFKKGLPVMAPCEVEDKASFRFSRRQLEQTAHVTAVWSWPIYEVDAKGQQTSAVSGVLNLDCTARGAFVKLSSNSEAFEKVMKKFAETASTII